MGTYKYVEGTAKKKINNAENVLEETKIIK